MRFLATAGFLCLTQLAGADTLPEWLTLGGELRTRLENTAGINYQPGYDDTALLTRIRLDVRVRPVRWFSINVQGQDARGLFTKRLQARSSYQDTANLRLVYVDVGSLETGPVAFRAGRQELIYGDQRMIGYNGWRNTGQSFDAARLRLRSGADWLDIFAASVIAVPGSGWNKRIPGQNLYGLYASLNSLLPQATLEPYVMWSLVPRLTTEEGHTANASRPIGGARAAGKLGKAWTYNTEMAVEAGAIGTDTISAWAGHWEISRNHRYFGEYNFASGDRDPKDGRRGTFEPPYASVHDRFGLADQVGWRNIHHLRAGVRLPIAPHWELLANWHHYWLASATDALYLPNGRTVARNPQGTAGRHVGTEPDLSVTWTPAAGLQISAGYARMFPGEFLKKAAPGSPLNFVFVMADWVF